MRCEQGPSAQIDTVSAQMKQIAWSVSKEGTSAGFTNPGGGMGKDTDWPLLESSGGVTPSLSDAVAGVVDVVDIVPDGLDPVKLPLKFLRPPLGLGCIFGLLILWQC